jgi:GT2 family glycosyltransferase
MPAARTASIVVPSRGGARRLPTLFASLASQTVEEWEAIVVLDGDIDESEAVVQAWADRIPVRAIIFSENRGRSAALNAGFAAATGDVLLRCDDDLELQPHHVAGHLARHAASTVGVVGLCKNVFPATPYAHAYGKAADARLRGAAYAHGVVAWRYWAANVSVTREVAVQVGEYDEDYRGYGWEDVDWGFRLHQAGVPVVIAGELEALHHGAAATTTTRAQRAFHSGAARRRFESKHGPNALPVTAPRGLWGRAVLGASAHLDEPRVTKVGAAIDTALPKLPTALGQKAVALLVESAAIAGYTSSGETQRVI